MSLEINQIYVGNCAEVLKQADDNSIDLIFGSPPYADLRSYGSGEGIIPPDQYVEWFLPQAEQFLRVLKPTGNFLLNIDSCVVNGERHLYIFDLILKLKRELGFLFIDNLSWLKLNRPPVGMANGRRLIPSWEFVLWFAKTKDYYLDIDAIRRPANWDSGRRNKSSRKPNRYGISQEKDIQINPKGVYPYNWFPNLSDIRQLFGDTNAVPLGSGRANTSNNDEDTKHPAVFSEDFAEWFIKGWSPVGGIVLDPWAGSGTTCVVADRLGRQYIGIDVVEDYVKNARDRVIYDREKRAWGK